jgi:hypothetical protein
LRRSTAAAPPTAAAKSGIWSAGRSSALRPRNPAAPGEPARSVRGAAHSRQQPVEVPAGVVRVITTEATYQRLVQRAFEKIRQAGTGMPAVMIRQLDALAQILEGTTAPKDRQLLLDQAAMIDRLSLSSVREESDQAHLRQILRAYEVHHNQRRPHRSLHAAAPLKPLPEPVDLEQYRVRRQARVAGLINEYRLVV